MAWLSILAQNLSYMVKIRAKAGSGKLRGEEKWSSGMGGGKSGEGQ
jgi:hypothetical protein